ncbi:hypothetical protein P7C71_g1882, partial [Lecanoromycetidae sp. Uapishka_2]
MTLTGFNHFLADPSTPDKPNGHSPISPRVTPKQDFEDTPARQVPDRIGRVASPPPSEPDVSSPVLSNLGSPTSELGSSPWSAAVGRAAMGKSGRVIEKLQGDNDRLQREKKLATVKLEEEVKRGESARSALESLQISNQNLSSIHESDKNFLTKKERRIEELRADLGMEKGRRESAENATRESRRERDEIVDQIRREAAEDRELARRANNQYDMLSKSWKGLEDRYERQTLRLRDDLQALRRQIEEDRRKLVQIEVIMDQLRQEGEKTRKAKEHLSSDFEAYKTEQEDGIREIRERAERNDNSHRQKLEQMEDMLGQMRYIVNVKAAVRDVE